MSETGKSIDIGQPIEGLLYDLDLLPEQLKPNTREYAAMFVISALHAELVKLRTPAPKEAPKIIGYSLGHGMGEPVYASPKAETQDMNEEIKFPVLVCQCPRKKEMTFGGFHVRNNEIICNLCYRPRYLKEGDKP